MQNIFSIVQIVVAVLLILVILLQQRGAGLSSAFGGLGEVYRVRRGAERFLFIATVVLACMFLGTAFLNLLV